MGSLLEALLSRERRAALEHLVDAVLFKALAARAGLARIRIRPGAARAELRWPPGVGSNSTNFGYDQFTSSCVTSTAPA